LKQIETLAAAAIGLDEKRGDTIAVQNLSFQQQPEQAPEPPSKLDRVRVTLNDWSSMIRYAALLILFMLAYLFLLRPIKKQAMEAFRQLPERTAAQIKAETAAGELAGISGDVNSLSDAQRKTLGLQRQLADKAKSEPAATGRLVQSWLREGAQ
jgi:flagellar M-ring protein FliF